VDGRVVRVKIAAKFLRRRLVQKPVKRTWRPDQQTAE